MAWPVIGDRRSLRRVETRWKPRRWWACSSPWRRAARRARPRPCCSSSGVGGDISDSFVGTLSGGRPWPGAGGHATSAPARLRQQRRSGPVTRPPRRGGQQATGAVWAHRGTDRVAELLHHPEITRRGPRNRHPLKRRARARYLRPSGRRGGSRPWCRRRRSARQSGGGVVKGEPGAVPWSGQHHAVGRSVVSWWSLTCGRSPIWTPKVGCGPSRSPKPHRREQGGAPARSEG